VRIEAGHRTAPAQKSKTPSEGGTRLDYDGSLIEDDFVAAKPSNINKHSFPGRRLPHWETPRQWRWLSFDLPGQLFSCLFILAENDSLRKMLRRSLESNMQCVRRAHVGRRSGFDIAGNFAGAQPDRHRATFTVESQPQQGCWAVHITRVCNQHPRWTQPRNRGLPPDDTVPVVPPTLAAEALPGALPLSPSPLGRSWDVIRLTDRPSIAMHLTTQAEWVEAYG